MLRYILVFFVCSVASYKYDTKWFEVPLDHFGYHIDKTFNIKYLVNDDHWDPDTGPIFLYPGNEAPIHLFAEHTGFMWDIAGIFKAKLIFAEHRYYGESLPFGNKSYENENIGYLTVAQTLADYADLINYLQGDSIRPKYPVIAFGGSYGAILAAYLRIKYPHLVAGAIVASGPVHMYPGMVPCDLYHRIVTRSFRVTGSEKCVENIRRSWSVIRAFLSTPDTNIWLEKQWKLCDPVITPADIETLIEFVHSMYDTLAMINYPFPTDFLLPLPGDPVKAVCENLNEDLNGEKLLEGIGKVLQIYTNYTGKYECLDYKNGDKIGSLQADGWNFQKCTDMVLPRCSTGKRDMFEPRPWSFTKLSEDCYKKYGVRPRRNSAYIEYGGNRLQAASNIVFSNGLLDPWAGGSILKNIGNSVIAVVMKDVAHHLDLMPSNPLDPQEVLVARNIHKQNINKWISEFWEQNKVKTFLK